MNRDYLDNRDEVQALDLISGSDWAWFKEKVEEQILSNQEAILSGIDDMEKYRYHLGKIEALKECINLPETYIGS